jgi:hypothetical protein
MSRVTRRAARRATRIYRLSKVFINITILMLYRPPRNDRDGGRNLRSSGKSPDRNSDYLSSCAGGVGAASNGAPVCAERAPFGNVPWSRWREWFLSSRSSLSQIKRRAGAFCRAGPMRFARPFQPTSFGRKSRNGRIRRSVVLPRLMMAHERRVGARQKRADYRKITSAL